mgnify:CR=1 FL=1
MAKSTPPVYAEKDDPIYSGRFVVSSMKYMRKENGINKSNMGNERRTATKSGSGSDIDHSGKKSGKTEKD